MKKEKVKRQSNEDFEFPDQNAFGHIDFVTPIIDSAFSPSNYAVEEPGKKFETTRGFDYRYMQTLAPIKRGDGADEVDDTTVTPDKKDPTRYRGDSPEDTFNYISFSTLEANQYGLFYMVEPEQGSVSLSAVGGGGRYVSDLLDYGYMDGGGTSAKKHLWMAMPPRQWFVILPSLPHKFEFTIECTGCTDLPYDFSFIVAFEKIEASTNFTVSITYNKVPVKKLRIADAPTLTFNSADVEEYTFLDIYDEFAKDDNPLIIDRCIFKDLTYDSTQFTDSEVGQTLSLFFGSFYVSDRLGD